MMKNEAPKKGPFGKTGYATVDHNKVTMTQVPLVGEVNSTKPDVKDGQNWNFPTGKKSQNDRPEGGGD